MPALELFNETLTGSFAPSKPFTIVNGLAVLDFALEISSPGTIVEWYFELTSEAPDTAVWFREVSEESPSAGVVLLSPLVRRFENLSADVQLDVQSAKAHDFCRIQIRVAVGAAVATVSTPIALPAVS